MNFLGDWGALVATATATATAAAVAATATTTAAAWSFFLRARLVDGEIATAVVLFVEAANGFVHGILRVHGDEGKTAWAAGFAVHGQMDVGDGAVVGEEGADVVLGGVEGQVAHIHFRVHIFGSFAVDLRGSEKAPVADFSAPTNQKESPDEQLRWSSPGQLAALLSSPGWE